ncbi:electron transport complex, RnfABCDGE type, E subunit [Beggiatoa alba B18LD]|uniref:Ion-translocating oxidoreductase complex subunit E n=1 Tax=Beggiatoa alba B18LD TaxID=395493 RepID=I3CGF7_9GAMM|nr:electron transport complex subunit E [Beggiatoa alba]EIJ42700.1 electron transport complex, RnfABCDGE type, E subunit [Beggiatoa alba B18LD]
MTTEYREIIYDGLWRNNTSFVQLLGLCPLLATTGTLVNGLGLGIATTLILIVTNASVSLIRHIVPNEVRIPIFVLIIAAVVTAVELLMKAFYYDLYMVLGIFIPLIVTNCFVIGRAEAFASRHAIDKSMLDGLMMGLGFTLALSLLGGLRELLGHGTLFAQAEIMFGEWGRAMTITVFEHYKGFLIAILPPGAFFGLALLIVLKNMIDQRLSKKVVKPVVVNAPTVQQSI